MIASAGCNRSGSQPAAGAGGSSIGTVGSSLAAEEEARVDSLRQIRERVAENEFDDAHELVAKHLQDFPEDPQAMALGAQTYAARDELETSLELIDKAAELWPENRQELHIDAADLLGKADRWNDAISRLEAVLESEPNYHRVRHTLVTMLNARGFRFDANEQARVLCRNGGGATAEELLGLINPTSVMVALEEKPDPIVPATIEKHGVMNVARALFDQGDVKAALATLEASDLIADNDPSAMAFHGQLLLESEQPDAFKKWLDAAKPALERYPSYWIAMGGGALQQQKNEAAVRMFAEAILREPGDSTAHEKMTQALGAADQQDAAERFEKRNEQLDQISQLTQKILSSPDRSTEMMTELTNLLSDVGRPMEALAWREMAMMQFGTNSQSPGAGEAAMYEMHDKRQALLKQEQQQPEELRKKLLCDLALDEFPLDTSWLSSEGEAESE